MTFQPFVPTDGYGGWLLLKRTLPAQERTWKASQVNQREAEYFREKISSVMTASELVSDRRLLRVALTAFGLEQDINAGAFIRKILSDGIGSDAALSNRMVDKSYRNFADKFGLDGKQVPKTLEEGFAEKILGKYYSRRFESEIGEQNASFRLALNAERELGEIARSEMSEDTKWFTIMGSKPLRQVLEKSFNLPAGFRNLDIDHQLRILKHRAQVKLGSSTVSQFSGGPNIDNLIKEYLIRDSVSKMMLSPAYNLLQLVVKSPNR